MKKIYSVTKVFILQFFISLNAIAINLPLHLDSSTEARVIQIQKNMDSQNWRSVYLDSLNLAEEIHRSIGVNAIVEEISNNLVAKYKEQVIATHSNNYNSIHQLESVGKTASNGWGPTLLPFDLKSKYSQEKSFQWSERWNVTKILTVNDKEIKAFPQTLRDDYYRLKANLVSYINKHINEILLLKTLALNAIEAAQHMDEIDQKEIMEIAHAAMQLSFHGRQNIQICTQIEHADSFSEFHSSSTTDTKYSFVLKSLGEQKKGSVKERKAETFSDISQEHAYTEFYCKSPKRYHHTQSVDKDGHKSINISYLDKLLTKAVSDIEFIKVTNKLYKSPIKNSWGNSLIANPSAIKDELKAISENFSIRIQRVRFKQEPKKKAQRNTDVLLDEVDETEYLAK